MTSIVSSLSVAQVRSLSTTAIANFTEEDVEHDPTPGVSFAPLPPEAGRVKSFEAWKKNFADTLYRTHRLEMFRVAAVKLVSKPHESERDFLARAQMALREHRHQDALEKVILPDDDALDFVEDILHQ